MTVALVVLAAGLIMLLIEQGAPGRAWPRVAGWWPRAIGLNAAQAGIVLLAGVTWDGWLQGLSLWALEDVLGPTGGAIAGYFAITFVYYWWHRWRHENPLLWRWLHQVHHSPQRLEVLTSFYKHPLEMAGNALLSSVILYLLCGLSPVSAAATLLTGLAELFYHWNVRTPHWLGYVVQRPESHCLHHQSGWHRQNYSDLPLWDMLFGTFHNPRRRHFTCGFGDHAEQRLAAMLRGRRVDGQANSDRRTPSRP